MWAVLGRKPTCPPRRCSSTMPSPATGCCPGKSHCHRPLTMVAAAHVGDGDLDAPQHRRELSGDASGSATCAEAPCLRGRLPRSQVASNVSDMKQPRLRRTQGPRRLCGKRLRAPATVTDRPRVRLLWRHMQDVVVLQTRKTHSRLAKKQSVRQSKPGEKNGKQKTHSGPDSEKEPFT